MREAKLPKFFKYRTARDLIRLGQDHDGGYIVSQSDVKKSDVLVSLGIGNDWSFEIDFINIKKVPIYAYDGFVNQKVYLKNILKRFLTFYKFNQLLESIKIYFSYLKFFRGEIQHIKKVVSSEDNEIFNIISLDSIIEIADKKNIFFSIDIEGFEYRIFDTLIAKQDQICGLVIEIHDCDLHLDKIKSFIEDFSLPLVHIHANNGSNIFKKKDNIPQILELTFSKNADLYEKHIIPHKLDMPGFPEFEDVKLVFDQ